MTDETVADVCVVTQPIDATGNAVRSFIEIIDKITSVSLVTAGLTEDSPIRSDREVVDISSKAMYDNVVLAIFQFIVNQIRMCRTISQRDEEIIYFFGSMVYVVPVLYSKVAGRTVVVHPRANVPLSLKLRWQQQLPNPLAKLLASVVWLLERTGYLLADSIVVYSPGMAEELNLAFFSKKLYTNGARFVHTDKFTVEEPYENRDRVVGFVGRLEEEKGIRQLAEIAKQLPESITFRFVGDGPLREWLESELKAEIENGAVELTGWIDHDDLTAEFNRLRLLVMYSEPTEGLPTVIMESMSCGTPVYATPVSGVPDLVRDHTTGMLLTDTDPDAAADRIVQFLDSEDAVEYSRRCRELIENEYDFEAAVERYESILLDVSV